MLRQLAFIILCSSVFVSCNLLPKKDRNKAEAIARVYEKYLYTDDLSGVIPAGTSRNDSVEMTTAYINNWIRQELLLKQAEDNLDETNRDFSKQIEQYHNSLIIYAYESELIKQKLDTVVSMSEIEDYYQKNQNNFHLRENIVLANYAIVKKDSPVATKIKALLLSKRESDKEKLHNLCQENGIDYMVNDGTWMSFADLTRKIPLAVYDQTTYLSRDQNY